jgi:hypothetical protein
MNKYVLLYRGTRDKAPTQESRAAWMEWFDSLGGAVVDVGNPFGPGREVTPSGTTELPLDRDGVTGYTLINASDIDAAEKIALSHPLAPSIQVYEAMPM